MAVRMFHRLFCCWKCCWAGGRGVPDGGSGRERKVREGGGGRLRCQWIEGNVQILGDRFSFSENQSWIEFPS